MARPYLGVDIGGTTIKAVLLQKRSPHRVRLHTVATPKNKKRFLRVLERFLTEVAGRNKLAGIGAGIAGMVDARRGIVIGAANLPFLDGWNAKKFFRKFNRNAMIDNDSRSFVRAEWMWGSARGYRHVAGLAIGTGIGGGIVIGGKMYHGSNNSAGEFGHTVIEGQKTLEQLGAKAAYRAMGDRSRVIGIGVANLIRSLDPDIVVLGGGGVTSGGVKMDAVKRTARNIIGNPVLRKTPIVKGILGDAAQAIGAALLFEEMHGTR